MPIARTKIRMPGRRALLQATCILALLMQGHFPAYADVAAPAEVRTIAIAAGPLVRALNQLADQTGLQIIYDAPMANGLESGGARGALSAEAALQQILAGTGLTYRFTAQNAVTLEVLAKDGVTRLGPLVVEGDVFANNAWGPVEGYVADRSATGTKTDTPLIRTPQSITVVTRDEIEARNATDISQALAYSPGVASGGHGTAGAIGGDTVVIRGFGGDGTTGPSGNEYIDGLRLSGTGYVTAAFDPYLFERVEVLKGPASVLYGQSTPGGILNMISKRPTETFQGEVGFQVGSNDLYKGILDVGGPLDSEGKYLYRLTTTGWDTDTDVDFSDRRRYVVAPAFTWQPNDRTSITLLTRMQRDDFNASPLNWLPTRGTVLDNPNGEISPDLYTGDTNYQKWDRSSYAVGYLAEHAFDDVFTVRQNFRYNYNKLDFAGVYIQRLRPDLTNGQRFAFGMIEHSNDWTLDNQLEAKVSTGPVEHKILLGVDGQILESDTDRELAAWSDIDVFDPDNDDAEPSPQPWRSQKQLNKQLGLYAQEQLTWQGLNLVFGVRQDWATGKLTDRIQGGSQKQSDDAFTWRAGVLYAFDAGISPYFSYSESFAPETGTDSSGQPFKPSTGQQFEAGIKFQPSGYDSFVTASAFNITRQNVLTQDPDNPDFNTQTGEVRSRGFELEGKASLSDGLDATVAYTFLDAEVTKSEDLYAGIDGETVEGKGRHPVAVPKHTASAWLNYTFQRGDLAGLGLGFGTRYVGETYGDNANSYMVPDFLLFEAALRYDFGPRTPALDGWIAQLNVSNLADNKYVSSCIGIDRCFYGAGRSIVGTLKFTW